MIQLSKEPLTREIAQILLDDAWRRLNEIDDILRGNPRYLHIEKIWSRIFTAGELHSIDEALTTLQEIVGGVIVDLEHNEPLPYPKEGRL